MGAAESQDALSRAKSRQRRIGLTSVASFISRIAGFLTSFATIPFTLHYLGTERFGLWMTVNSVLAMLAFADLGIGNGLLNIVAKANGDSDRATMRAAISSAYVVLTLIAVVLLALMMVAIPAVDWRTFFNLQTPLAAREAPNALRVFALCFALNIPFGVVTRVQLALQLGFINGIWQICGALGGLAGIALAIYFDGGLPWLVAAVAGMPVLFSSLGTVVFFLKIAPDLRPTLSAASLSTMNRLVRVGMLFFALQLTASLAYSADNTIASRLLGAKEVADYSIAVRLFSVSSVVLGMVLQPLWPAFTEAIARRDLGWVRITLRRMVISAAVVTTVGSCCFLWGFDFITDIWLHRRLHVTLATLLGLGFWSVTEAVGMSLAMFLNAAHVVRFQLILAALFAVTCIAVKILAVKSFGVQGMPWATLSTYLPIVLLPTLLRLPRLMRSL